MTRAFVPLSSLVCSLTDPMLTQDEVNRYGDRTHVVFRSCLGSAGSASILNFGLTARYHLL